ncbi:MAG: VCBS repeat-containing protein, partial [Planctomycetota bacterium]
MMRRALPFLLAAAAASPTLAAGVTADASYVDASVRVDGDLLDWVFVDVDVDGQDELCVSVLTPSGGREIQLHRTTQRSIAPEAYATIPVLEDIVAWTFADVRPDLDGRELVFLTRQGAWSFDPRRTGYRGNIAKLCEIDLLYDVPSPRALPYWSYVLQTDAGEQLLLPDRSGFRVFGPRSGAAEGQPPWGALRSYRRTSGYTPPDPSDTTRRQREAERRADGRQVRLSATVGDVLPPFAGGAAASSLIEDDFRIQAPALVDLDADGAKDMLLVDGDRLNVYMATGKGLPAMPTRSEPIPAFLTRDGQRAALSLVDIDGNGRLDVLGIWSERNDGFENIDWRIYVMRSTPNRLLPEKANQVFRFKAADLRATVADIDGDRKPDLAIRRFEVPSMLETVTGLEFRYAHLLYLGGRGGRFDQSPAMRSEQTYDEESVRDVLRNRELVLDCSGDGIADLVEVDLKGNVGVRRLKKESSFFSGTSWSIDGSYWKRYGSRGSITSL